MPEQSRRSFFPGGHSGISLVRAAVAWWLETGFWGSRSGLFTCFRGGWISLVEPKDRIDLNDLLKTVYGEFGDRVIPCKTGCSDGARGVFSCSRLGR
jgi:hypothetical protein